MILASSMPEKFLTRFSNGEHVSISDTTPEKGGRGLGFRPHEFLEAALANCMNMSLRMHAERQGIPLSGVSVAVSLDRRSPHESVFEFNIDFQDAVPDAHRQVLLQALESSPVRVTLSKQIRFRQKI